MAEAFVKEKYESAHRKVDEKFDGGIVVGFKMEEGDRHFVYPSGSSFFRLAELKIEREAGVAMGKNVFYVGMIKLQETEKGKEIKLEEVDLSKVNKDDIIEKEMQRLRILKKKNY